MPRLARPAVDAHTRRGRKPVEYWALFGAVCLAFWAYVLIAWVTGPYFHHVDPGPDTPPTYMKVALVTWQAASVPIVIGLLWFFLIRPYRRSGEVPLYGLLVLAGLTMMLQDPLSNYTGQWYNYNTWMVNVGSFVNEIPGWRAFGAPGQQSGFPIFFHLLAYSGCVLFCVWCGTKVMRAATNRWPNIGPLRLILVCFVAMVGFDFVIEGIIWTPLGFYTMPGGHWAIFPNSYNKFPFHEVIVGGAWWACWPVLVWFRNDRGETIVERGVGEMTGSLRKKTTLRLLALVAFCQLGYLVTYNLPIMMLWAPNPGTWPKAVQEKSYFTGHMCGQEVNRLCPGQGIPLLTDSWVDNQGRLQGPKASAFQPIPLDSKKLKPYQGKAFGYSTNP